ncbi:carbohydrate esterase [Corynebacterium sp. BCW_4722]|nr:carbohydrate esterase [Corynebacterium sp. BCW_4722]
MRSSRNVFVVAAALVVLALIGLGIYQWQSGDGEPPVAEPPHSSEPAPSEEVPAEPEWCPAAELISVPGTWESAPDDDPFNPQANPQSFMLSITAPLQQQYDQKQLRVFTVPYTAQFKNIQSPQGRAEKPYDVSRAEGTAKLRGELAHVAEQCSRTQFIIAGFSQGAVIVGDVAAEIGAGNGPIPPERLAGAVMVADGRRENGVGVNPGAEVGGVGAEIALQPLQRVADRVTPGATLTGPRPGGFGAVSDRAFEICAPNDTICDAPADIGTALGRAQELIAANGVHAMYATNPDAIPGTTAPEWTLNWVRTVVDSL